MGAYTLAEDPVFDDPRLRAACSRHMHGRNASKSRGVCRYCESHALRLVRIEAVGWLGSSLKSILSGFGVILRKTSRLLVFVSLILVGGSTQPPCSFVSERIKLMAVNPETRDVLVRTTDGSLHRGLPESDPLLQRAYAFFVATGGLNVRPR